MLCLSISKISVPICGWYGAYFSSWRRIFHTVPLETPVSDAAYCNEILVLRLNRSSILSISSPDIRGRPVTLRWGWILQSWYSWLNLRIVSRAGALFPNTVLNILWMAVDRCLSLTHCMHWGFPTFEKGWGYILRPSTCVATLQNNTSHFARYHHL